MKMTGERGPSGPRSEFMCRGSSELHSLLDNVGRDLEVDLTERRNGREGLVDEAAVELELARLVAVFRREQKRVGGNVRRVGEADRGALIEDHGAVPLVRAESA